MRRASFSIAVRHGLQFSGAVDELYSAISTVDFTTRFPRGEVGLPVDLSVFMFAGPAQEGGWAVEGIPKFATFSLGGGLGIGFKFQRKKRRD